MKKSQPLFFWVTGGATDVSEEGHEPFDLLSLLPLPQLDPRTTCSAEPLVLYRSSSQRDTALLCALSTSGRK